MSLSLADRDRAALWHPYTQHKNSAPPIPVIGGRGSLLFDEKGQSYIDAISSWWVNIHGHSHPYIADKIFEQAKKLEHVIFTGFTHEPAVSLAERLLKILPGPFSRIFYSDNGSTAVEVAIKMAIQYWQNKNDNNLPAQRNKVLAFRHSYHGDTFGAMSVSSRSVFTRAFDPYLFEVEFIDPPSPDNILELKSRLEGHIREYCCFIFEPLLQGAGGMRLMDASSLDEFLAFARDRDLICIADEVLTGFGRTGQLFASSALQNKADIVCLSKGLTGGTLALGVTAATERIYEAFLSDDRSKTFFHGHSFTANPIACAAALASLDLLLQEECLQKIKYVSDQNARWIQDLEAHRPTAIQNPRSLGTLLAYELASGPDGYLNTVSARVTEKAIKNGIYLRPLGNTVYILPPYCIDPEQLQKLHEFLIRIPGEIN